MPRKKRKAKDLDLDSSVVKPKKQPSMVLSTSNYLAGSSVKAKKQQQASRKQKEKLLADIVNNGDFTPNEVKQQKSSSKTKVVAIEQPFLDSPWQGSLPAHEPFYPDVINHLSDVLANDHGRLKLKRGRFPQLKEAGETDVLAHSNRVDDGAHEVQTHLETLYSAMHDEWWPLLHKGYNLLFHGLGAKTKYIFSLCKEKVPKGCGLLWFNGLGNRISALEIVRAVAKNYSLCDLSSSDPVRAAAQLRESINSTGLRKVNRLYLLVSNIQGQQLRVKQGLDALAILVNADNVHLLASVDGEHHDLLWHAGTAANFNWVYRDITTMSVCLEGLAAFSARPGMSRTVRSGPITFESVRQFLSRVNDTMRKVFFVLAEHQVQNPQSPGLSLTNFTDACRAKFLAKSEQEVRQHLEEFKDHQLVRSENRGGFQRFKCTLSHRDLKELLVIRATIT